MTPERIRTMIDASGLTIARFADEIGVTRVTVHTWLSGRQRPSRMASRALERFAARLARKAAG